MQRVRHLMLARTSWSLIVAWCAVFATLGLLFVIAAFPDWSLNW